MTPLLVTSLASDAAVGCVSAGNFTMAPASTLRHPPMFCAAVGVGSAMISISSRGTLQSTRFENR